MANSTDVLYYIVTLGSENFYNFLIQVEV